MLTRQPLKSVRRARGRRRPDTAAGCSAVAEQRLQQRLDGDTCAEHLGECDVQTVRLDVASVERERPGGDRLTAQVRHRARHQVDDGQVRPYQRRRETQGAIGANDQVGALEQAHGDRVVRHGRDDVRRGRELRHHPLGVRPRRGQEREVTNTIARERPCHGVGLAAVAEDHAVRATGVPESRPKRLDEGAAKMVIRDHARLRDGQRVGGTDLARLERGAVGQGQGVGLLGFVEHERASEVERPERREPDLRCAGRDRVEEEALRIVAVTAERVGQVGVGAHDGHEMHERQYGTAGRAARPRRDSMRLARGHRPGRAPGPNAGAIRLVR